MAPTATCKPDPVSLGLPPGLVIIPLCGGSRRHCSVQPGQNAPRTLRSMELNCGPQSLLALFGLAPDGVYRASRLPGCWCALTAPFQPYHAPSCEGRSAVCFLWHWPSLTVPGVTWHPCPAVSGLSSPEKELFPERPPWRSAGTMRNELPRPLRGISFRH
jgi:hypothetical protein